MFVFFCLPTQHLGVLMNSLKRVRAFQIELAFESAGADPGFFLGGGALVSCSTSTPINHIVFFFCRIPVVAGGVRTPCTLPLDPPLRCWLFKGKGKYRSTRRKPFRRKGENQQQTQPRYVVYGATGFQPGHNGWRRCCHHCVTFAPCEGH